MSSPCKRPKDEANITCPYSVQFNIICQPDVYNVCVCVFGGGGGGGGCVSTSCSYDIICVICVCVCVRVFDTYELATMVTFQIK